MKQFAVQSAVADCPIDTLCDARSSLGGSYIHRMSEGDPYLMVYDPADSVASEAWLAGNGWISLPYTQDFGTQIGATIQGLLLSHASSILATDTTSQAMTKIASSTGMKCFQPFS